MPRAAFLAFLICLTTFLSREATAAEELVTWKDCVLEARRNHPDLVSAMEKLNQSRDSRNITHGALWPQVTGGLSAETSKSPASKSSTSSSSSRVDDYVYSVTGKQLLFDGFKTYFDVEQASRNIEVNRYNYEVVSSNVRLRLRTAFVDLLKAQELLALTQDIAHRRKQSRDLIQLRYQAGREHRGSLLTAEANLAEAEFEEEKARRGIGLAQRQLSKELGRTKATPISVEGNFEAADKNSSKPDFEVLSTATPFLKELVAQKEAARWGVKSAVASLFPQVYASGTAERTDSVWPPHGREWSAGVSLTMPFFEGGSLIAGASRAQAEYHQAQADEKSGRDGVILTLETTWTQFQDALGQVSVEAKFLEAAEERAKIAEAEYSTGLISFNEWIIIEDNLVNTQKSMLDAKANALLAEANWFQAKGETLDVD